MSRSSAPGVADPYAMDAGEIGGRGRFPVPEPSGDTVSLAAPQGSLITYAQARAALAAAARDRRLVGGARAEARRQLDDRWRELATASVSDDVVHLAGDLSDREGPRGYDAVHLATAALVDAGDVLFVTWDAPLAHAAARAGMATRDRG